MSETGEVMLEIFDRPIREDQRKKFWKLHTDTPIVPGTAVFTLGNFYKGVEKHIRADLMIHRSMQLGTLAGQKHAEWLLDNQELIPEQWRRWNLLLPGTIWNPLPHLREIPMLHWNSKEERWELLFARLTHYANIMGARVVFVEMR